MAVFVNELVLKDTLAECRRDSEFERDDILWDTVAKHSRSEIDALLPVDLKLVADQDDLPIPRTTWVKSLGDSERSLLRAITKVVRLYCRLRLSRDRDSSPPAP